MKRLIGLLVTAALLFFVLPLWMVKVIPSDAGMMVTILLWLGIYPAFVAIGSFYTGGVRFGFFVPFLLVGLYAFSVPVVFHSAPEVFYLILYLVLGLIFTVIGAAIESRKRRTVRKEK